MNTDGQIRIWTLSKDERPIEDLASEAQVLNSSRLGQKGGLMANDISSLSYAWQTLQRKYPGRFRRSAKLALAGQ